MAPTVCETEFPMVGNTISMHVRRRKSPNEINIIKRQTFTLEQMILPIKSIIETSLTSRENCLRNLEYTNTISNCSTPNDSTKYSTKTDEDYRKLVTSRKDLSSIIIRTVILVQRNCILQRRINALQAETRRFLCSVLNNPENQCQVRSL